MRKLAKAGFSRSHTYFTWRNKQAELTDYLTDLTQDAPKEYMRPNFFVNAPDIDPSCSSCAIWRVAPRPS